MSRSISWPFQRVASVLGISVFSLLALMVRPANADDKWAVGSGGWSSTTTWNDNTVPGNSDTVYIGYVTGALTATVSLSQNVTSGTVHLGYSNGSTGTLNLANSNLTASSLYLGSSGTGIITRGTGTFAVGNIQVSNVNSLTFASGDTANNLYLYTGASATTSSVGNITSGVLVSSGSTLTLNAALNVGSGQVNVSDTGSVLNAQGNAITAGSLYLGWYGGSPTLSNRGTLTATNLYVRDQSLNLTPADAVSSFNLSNGATALGSGVSVANLYLYTGATATTSSVGNITSGVLVSSGSTLTLNAALNVGSGQVNVSDTGSVLNAQGNAITAGSLYLGWYGGNGTLTNDGILTVTGNYYQANNTVVLHNGNDALGSINLSGDSILRVASGQGTGLTLTNSASGALNIARGSILRLELDGDYQGWIFRWNGDHVSDLNALIADGMIDFVVTNGGLYTVGFDNIDNYTYVYQPVPEPYQVLLVAVAGLGGLRWLRGRRVPATA